MDVEAHIVVVDDDEETRNELRDYFSRRGFSVSTADGGEQLREILGGDGNEIDLVVLDLIMPGEDGFALTDIIRRNCDSGIIILSAVGDPADQVLGLELGADDYVTKPCDPRALLARIRSVLRRRAEIVPGDTPAHINCLEFSGYRLLPASRQFLSANGHEIPLTTAEFDLLELLAKNPGRVMTRDQLVGITKNRALSPFDRSIDILVSRIRKKIELDPREPKIIRTIRNVGYLFTADVTET
jgi:two-component system OmpR family response regulator